MLQVEINGKQISVEKGTSVIEAASQAGTLIPHFCYHKKLSIAANCRMCLVEVEKVPKPLPACATAVTEGMKVNTHSTMASGAQRGVMEFLLINHPLDCPVCDQGGECQLQDLAVGYGQSASRFREHKLVTSPKHLGPLVSAKEMSRCIKCTRCIRFTEEIAGYQELGMINRGEHSEIVTAVGKVVNSEISGNVIDLCPVGALTSKPFRYNCRNWELSRRKSISAHDSLGSNLIIQVKDKTVRRVLPLENESINECWLSDKDRFAYEGLNHADRIRNPMIKQDNKWHTVDWITALKYIIKGLTGVTKDHGKDAIGIWANSTCTVEELYLLKKLANQFGIKNIDSQLRTVDYRLNKAKTGALWLGQSLESLLSSDVIVVLGSYLRQDQPLLTARIRQAVNHGCQLVVVQAKAEELYIPNVIQKIVHPNEWIAYLQKLKSGKNKKIASLIQNAQKVSIILGEEAQMHPEFAAIYLAAQDLAQSCSATLGIFPGSANAVAADILGLYATEEQYSFNAMLDHAKKAIILVNVEPNIDVNNGSKALSALKQAETVIAMTPYLNDSLLEYADILLPIATFTETPGSFINMEGKLQSFHSTTPVLGFTKPLWKVLRVLGNLLNLAGFDYENCQEVLAEAIKDKTDLSSLLNNSIDAKLPANKVINDNLIRVGGVTIYSTDAIVRRANSLQQTIQAVIPEALVNLATLQSLGLNDKEIVVASQPEGQKIKVTVSVNDSLPNNVVYLPLHQQNWNLGPLMSEIVLERG